MCPEAKTSSDFSKITIILIVWLEADELVWCKHLFHFKLFHFLWCVSFCTSAAKGNSKMLACCEAPEMNYDQETNHDFPSTWTFFQTFVIWGQT